MWVVGFRFGLSGQKRRWASSCGGHVHMCRFVGLARKLAGLEGSEFLCLGKSSLHGILQTLQHSRPRL